MEVRKAVERGKPEAAEVSRGPKLSASASDVLRLVLLCDLLRALFSVPSSELNPRRCYCSPEVHRLIPPAASEQIHCSHGERRRPHADRATSTHVRDHTKTHTIDTHTSGEGREATGGGAGADGWQIW